MEGIFLKKCLGIKDIDLVSSMDVIISSVDGNVFKLFWINGIDLVSSKDVKDVISFLQWMEND